MPNNLFSNISLTFYIIWYEYCYRKIDGVCMYKKLILLINIILFNYTLEGASRIKDIVDVEGIRDNLLIGYGLVVGLNGTGDNLSNIAFTQKGLIDILERLGINARGSSVKTKNVAAVMVTAKLPPFARQGSKMDITVSTLGDAKSIENGTLLATPLLGADGQVYAVAQGQISISNFKSKLTNSTQAVTTNAYIPNGAIIEREINFSFDSMESIRLALKNPDISTSVSIARIINNYIGHNLAKAEDPGTVGLIIPTTYKNNIVNFLAEIEQLVVEPDNIAKIIIDETSGTIVMGDNVRISTVAIAQGNLSVTIIDNIFDKGDGYFTPNSLPNNSMPNSGLYIEEQTNKQLGIINEPATLGELVTALNALGVGPRDLINILQNIKAAGALQADIEIR